MLALTPNPDLKHKMDRSEEWNKGRGRGGGGGGRAGSKWEWKRGKRYTCPWKYGAEGGGVTKSKWNLIIFIIQIAQLKQ